MITLILVSNKRMGIFDFLKNSGPDNKHQANIIISNAPPKLDVDAPQLSLNALPIRDQLVLLLIAKTSMNNPRTLGLRLDMCDFPGNEGKSVANLVRNNLVYFATTNGFGHPLKYATTTLGDKFLKNCIVRDEIINDVQQMSNPDFMLELIGAILEKMHFGQ